MGIRIITRKIEVKFAREGIHSYPAALTDPKLNEVSFLGYPHRHMFHFTVQIQVFQNDRDIEFILFKRELEALYSTDGALNMSSKSCEQMAEELLHIIASRYPTRTISVNVSEDGESGAFVYGEPTVE
jgi:hypothetical protein